MISAILLVFSMGDMPAQVSKGTFKTLDECADFVDMLAGTNVMNDDYSFEFSSMEPSDGSIVKFKGRCVVQESMFHEKAE
jgi:hypothetical protein